MRAPTPIELTCADPNAPCKLPNQFLADPPLNAVISKTVEAGARGRVNENTKWSAAVFQTRLDNDIQFIASGSGATNAGYFQNVGSTRRQGVELYGATRAGPFAFDLRYNYLDATYRSTFAVSSPNNSSADDDGTIIVRPGDRIPGLPRHSVKLRTAYEPMEQLAIGVNVVYASSQYAFGDENNRDSQGQLPSYTVVHLDARYDVTKDLQLFVLVDNLFDRRYQNLAVLGSNVFTGPNQSFGPAQGIDPVPEQFRASGAPRGIWVGVHYSFGGKADRG